MQSRPSRGTDPRTAAMDSSTASTASASANKAKPNNKPKRPLSAYNLFYRFKRTKVLAVLNNSNKNHDDEEQTKAAILRYINAPPGLEDQLSPSRDLTSILKDDVTNGLRRELIRSALLAKLGPKDNRNRTHRKSHGAMSFLEMNKLMCASWKRIDEYARKVFEELADEGRVQYRERIAEYEKNPQASAAAVAVAASAAAVVSAEIIKRAPTKKIKASDPVPMAAAPATPKREKIVIKSTEEDVEPTAKKPPAYVVNKVVSKEEEVLPLLPPITPPRPPVSAIVSPEPPKKKAAITHKTLGNKKDITEEEKKKRESERPKRPLTSYNLFYRFKRSKLIEAAENMTNGKSLSEATSLHLINAIPGLEDSPYCNTYDASTFEDDEMASNRRRTIRLVLLENLSPKDQSKRTHRKKSNQPSSMSFLEMNKLMCASWKSVDAYSRSVFEELAEEGRKVYAKKVKEYEKKYPSLSSVSSSPVKSSSIKRKLSKTLSEVSSSDDTSSSSVVGVETPKKKKRKLDLDVIKLEEEPILPVKINDNEDDELSFQDIFAEDSIIPREASPLPPFEAFAPPPFSVADEGFHRPPQQQYTPPITPIHVQVVAPPPPHHHSLPTVTASPTNVTASYYDNFGSMSLPFFPEDVIDDCDYHAEQQQPRTREEDFFKVHQEQQQQYVRAVSNCSTTTSLSPPSDDNPAEASVDDFMQLIARLDESLSDS